MCVTEEVDIEMCELIVFVAYDNGERQYFDIGFWKESSELHLSGVEIGGDSSLKCNIPLNIKFVTTDTSIMHSISA